MSRTIRESGLGEEEEDEGEELVLLFVLSWNCWWQLLAKV